MSVPLLGHPFGAGEVTVERLPGAARFTLWIDVQHDLRHFLSVRAGGVRVQQSQIGDYVFLMIHGQHRTHRRGVGDIEIDRRLFHGTNS